jgi:tetratricopeptide (TPR) repeat protein
MSRRFDAERTRWQADREELRIRDDFGGDLPPEKREHIRELHIEVDREYGVEEPPSSASLANADVARRLRIAGASALYAAELAAHDDSNEELAEEYARIGRVYDFDREVAIRAGIGEGRTREHLGDLRGALDRYVSLLDGPAARAPGRLGSGDLLLLDLEIHSGLLARRCLAPEEAQGTIRRVVRRIERRTDGWDANPVRSRLKRRRAEGHFLADNWSEGLRELRELADSAGSAEERAELELLLGEVREAAGVDRSAAEASYRKAAAQGDRLMDGAAARVRLGDLLIRSGRAWEALEVLDALLGLGARVLEGRQAEALVLKARSLVRLDRWEDALPVLNRAAALEPRGPFPLVAAALSMRRLRRFTRPVSEPAIVRLVEVAERVPSEHRWARVPRPWVEVFREERTRGAWRDCVEDLLLAARIASDQEVRSRARAEAARLAEERLRDVEWAETIREAAVKGR